MVIGWKLCRAEKTNGEDRGCCPCLFSNNDAIPACIELQAVYDEMHEKYYGKAGYCNAGNFVMKVKWFT